MKALDMPPAFAAQYLGDGFSTHAKLIRNGLMCHAIRAHQSNRPNILISQLCQRMILALLFAVKHEISNVFRSAAPSKIAEAIVRCVAVAVTRFKAFAASPHKGFKNHNVNIGGTRPTQPDQLATMLVVDGGAHLFPLAADTPLAFVARPNASVVRSGISDVIRDVGELDAQNFREWLHVHSSQYSHQRTEGTKQ